MASGGYWSLCPETFLKEEISGYRTTSGSQSKAYPDLGLEKLTAKKVTWGEFQKNNQKGTRSISGNIPK